MPHRNHLMIAFVCSSLGWSACGGSSGSTCGSVQPCGGSVVGDWKIVDSCLELDTTGLNDSDFCPQASVDLSSLTLTGDVAYRADMTYTVALTVGMTLTFGFPSACLTSGGITLTCAQFDAAIQSELAADPDPTIESYRCAAGAGDVCNCNVRAAPMNSSETGTYTTASNLISYLASDGSSSTDAYCVQGDRLNITQTKSGTSPDDPALSGTLVLARQ